MYYYNPGHDLLKTGKSTAYMTSDEFLVSLNTAQDSLSDRGVWNRDDDRNAGWDGTSKTPKQMLIDDTLYFAITSPEELVGYLDLLIQKNGLARGALMNDISFGKDTATLSKRKLERGAADPFNCLDENYGYVLNSNNENSRVQAGKVAGGVAVFSESNGKIRSVSKDAVAFAGGISAYQKNDMDFAQMAVSSTGNRGTVYAEGQAAIAGGIVGQSISLKLSFNVITESFNYGTIVAKADSFAYVAGIVGNMRNTLLQKVYNRGAVIHEALQEKKSLMERSLPPMRKKEPMAVLAGLRRRAYFRLRMPS